VQLPSLAVQRGTHVSPSQRCPESHVWQSSPPVPQALSLVPRRQLVSTQQPVGQLVASQTHEPLTHRCPGTQAVAHEPQCSLLVCRSAQPSEQKTVSPGQAVQCPPRHWPLQHSRAAAQAAPSPWQAQRVFPSDPAALKPLQHLLHDGG
jgi:hypothetical protein